MAELIDTRKKRVKLLKEIITGLHEGVPMEEVRRQLGQLVRQTDSSEIAAMEQELIADGMPPEKIMALCDLHAEAVSDILVIQPAEPIAAGHPVDTFQRENEAVRQVVEAFRTVCGDLADKPEEESLAEAELASLRRLYGELMDLEKHYARKEHLLFPILERHGIEGPSQVMWGKDDEVREALAGLGEVLAEVGVAVGEWHIVREAVVEPTLQAIEEMVRKEENILLPMARNALTEAEWGEIWAQSAEIGYCLVEPGEEYAPAAGATEADQNKGQNGKLVQPTGALTHEQLAGIFRALPVDLTFVDAEDRVRYFTKGAERIFSRSTAILGRKVQHCHPPSSVGTVERILSDFRSGRQDACSFWINLKGRFVYIRYFAVCDEAGQYMGTLEVTQDLTGERALEGERRLLEYENEN
ncbi:MAG: DUF438 domain-containing protein [Candidatus Latescibacteria bacterium]|jgi:hypothetical protein|nr:DUF438 domain-containing protein [Candidatus Latescibacterota bacterium]